ncbi:ATP-binding protein [Thomasclavelia ramosa]|uniref:ATP-binding protein n=1 Tax=Thomasclavelia ramosa TaxID=1547 RepID=UPI000E54A44E|nr:ATP-binding protein [Thomasclavelia ramosa]RGT26575.1 hypothetical protein DWX42_05105 [Thomasclavelia ramosa]
MRSIKDMLGIPKDADTSQYQTEADFLNDNVGELNKRDGVDCTLCKNRGYVYKMVDGHDHAVRFECGCMAKRKTIINARKSGLEKLLNYRLDEFNVNKDFQRTMKDKVKQYLKYKSNHWFVMLGQSGAGKTHLCSVVARNYLSKNREVKYIVWDEYIRNLKNELYGDDYKAIDKVKMADVLYIDDFFKGKISETDKTLAFDIINYRYNNSLVTIISSELLLQELIDVDAAIAGRIKQMAADYIVQIAYDDERNYRLK